MNQSNQLTALEKELESIRILFQEVQSLQEKQYERITEPTELGQCLNEQRKTLGIDLETLHLQTDISLSTLKRLFKDPSQVRFSTLLLVAETLGVKLCIEK